MQEQNKEINSLETYLRKERERRRARVKEETAAALKILGIFFLGLFFLRVGVDIIVNILK